MKRPSGPFVFALSLALRALTGQATSPRAAPRLSPPLDQSWSLDGVGA